ncbi:MAG TPA: hypothetical protein PL129_10210, partial [bacterium]|nr:hypothetical protein [bacterium]
LITGGARGITAAIARALAKRSGGRLVLCGRSPLPEIEDDPDLEYDYYIRYCLQELNLSPDEIIRGFNSDMTEAQERFIEDFKGEDEMELEQ